jgi:sugar phosphate isomerase/epimerase
MNTGRLGCSTITFRMLGLPEALDRIAVHGLRMIDLGAIARFCPHAAPVGALDEDLARLADEITSRGLRVSSVNAWSLTHLNDPDSVELPYLRASLNLASAVGAGVVSVQPGRAVPDERWRDPAHAVATQLNLLGREARELGLSLSVEAPHKGTLAERFDRALELIGLLDLDVVGVTLDTSHVPNAGATIQEALAAYGPYVSHVHLRDYKDGSILVTPGDGEIDFAEVFTGLEGLGYRGDYNLELEYGEAAADKVTSELERALRHLRLLGTVELRA